MIYGYVRVSTQEQANSGLSLEAQQTQIAGYAASRSLDGAIKFHIDRAVSGSTPFNLRPSAAQMVAQMRKGDVVIATKLDRMFRNASDALQVLEGFKKAEIHLHLIDMGGDVTGNGIAKLVFTILSAVAENERDRIRERICDAKAQARKESRFSGGSRPFGYRIVGDRLVEDELEQLAIMEMRKRVMSGATLRAVGRSFAMHPQTVKNILERQI